eukprot:scaffold75415_cov67-Cyclotella_meneghiniana.AAC.3
MVSVTAVGSTSDSTSDENKWCMLEDTSGVLVRTGANAAAVDASRIIMSPTPALDLGSTRAMEELNTKAFDR